MRIETLERAQAWLAVAAAILFLVVVLKKGRP
jgi:hypothetical protein